MCGRLIMTASNLKMLMVPCEQFLVGFEHRCNERGTGSNILAQQIDVDKPKTIRIITLPVRIDDVPDGPANALKRGFGTTRSFDARPGQPGDILSLALLATLCQPDLRMTEGVS